MTPIIYFLAGMGLTLFAIITASWIDVAILQKPMLQLSSKKRYIYACAWEFSFFFAGIVLGLLVK